MFPVVINKPVPSNHAPTVTILFVFMNNAAAIMLIGTSQNADPKRSVNGLNTVLNGSSNSSVPFTISNFTRFLL